MTLIHTCFLVYFQVPHHAGFSKKLFKTRPRFAWYNRSHSPPIDFDTLSENELTVVTAYFDVGPFQKGPGGPLLGSHVYQKFMTVFAQIRNPVVAYFDSSDHAALMQVLRANHPKTRVVVVDRSTLWSFREMEPHIAVIFSQRHYPWHPPNTVISTYSAAMHAKYELMQWTIRDNPFHSAYICWLDLGLFRDLASDSVSAAKNARKSFRLGIPADLNNSAVAYTEVFPSPPIPDLTAEEAVKSNIVWVCGCFFVGRVDVMWQWSTEYLSAVESMVSENWMSTDQQVLAWLMLGEGRAKLNPRTSLQLYRASGGSHPWFHLGYVAKKAGEQ